MARQFGIITTSAGVAGVVINSLSKSGSTEIAEARNKDGKVTDLKAYSRGETIKFDGLLDTDALEIRAGDIIENGDKTYLIESVDQNETNTGYATVSISARTADAAAVEAYSAEA